ncbi:hypothetical protein [Spongiibacter tropicus]|uniref:hypothetical protein n=1 Tax=Spongiibacter tropicus TaxID=454602 RepID=UPI0035BE791F
MTYKGFSRAALSAAILTLAACGGGSGGGGGTTSVPEGTPGSVERLIFPVVSASNRSLFDMYTTDGSAEGTGLLKDFNEGQPAIQQFNGRNPILFDDGKFYFSAQSPNEGRELRVSDGTEAGTSVLVDIEGSSGPLDLQWMDGKLAFSAGTTGSAREFFVYDLDAETLTEIDVGGVASINIQGMQTVGNSIFILGRGVTSDSRNVPALYVSDGSQEGTQLVFVEGEPVGGSVAVKQPAESVAAQRIEPEANAPYVLADGDDYPTNIKLHSLTSFAGRLFFLANNDPNNQSSLLLYSVAEDGSDVRRELGEDVTFVQNLTVVGDTLYFYADRRINAATFTRHVYAYDGTTLHESGDFPEELFTSNFYSTSLGLFIVTSNNVYRTTLEDGEFSFKNMHPGDTMTTYVGVKSRTQFGELFTEVDGTIYFVAETIIAGQPAGDELWKTDGTPEGTVFALETNDLTSGDTISSSPRSLLTRYADVALVSGEVAGKLLFSAYDNSPTPKLHAYISDGTAEGTVKLMELPNQVYRSP